jgi:hypothetical protein
LQICFLFDFRGHAVAVPGRQPRLRAGVLEGRRDTVYRKLPGGTGSSRSEVEM